MRVAFASEDGKRVHQHFGHATRFWVYEVSPAGAALVDVRDNDPSCGSVEQPEAHARTLDRLADCDALVIACIGPGALRLVEARGLTCYETEDLVASALAELALDVRRRAGAHQP